MGLDMYINTEKDDLLYWRKEPAIHAWFEALAVQKKIEFEVFNCVDVPLTKDDILKFRMDINNQNLDFGASGFFFGSNKMDQDEQDEWAQLRLHECGEMLTSIECGNKLHYSSWW